jgi:carbon-monoxide dehydrogenase medium subunit
MPKVVGYHRPVSLDEALGLLSQPDTAVLAGGTRLNASRAGKPVAAVDLQALGLSGISVEGDRVRLGATTTLDAMARSQVLGVTLAELARREVPSTLRTLATIGGTVALGEPESELLTGLLAGDALVSVARPAGNETAPLSDVLADPTILTGGIITAVSVEVSGVWSAERTGRTPGDRGIVTAVARRRPDGTVSVALSGVASTPILADAAPSGRPVDDFRGSLEYRTHLAAVLTDRVRKAVAK